MSQTLALATGARNPPTSARIGAISQLAKIKAEASAVANLKEVLEAGKPARTAGRYVGRLALQARQLALGLPVAVEADRLGRDADPGLEVAAKADAVAIALGRVCERDEHRDADVVGHVEHPQAIAQVAVVGRELQEVRLLEGLQRVRENGDGDVDRSMLFQSSLEFTF